MVLSIKIESEDFKKENTFYKNILKRSQDLKTLERELGDLQREELKLRFLSSPITDVGGVVYGNVYWNALSDWYLAENPRRVGKQIMIDRGKLMTEATTPGFGNTSRIEQTGSEENIDFEYEFSINTYYAQKQHDLRELLFWSEGLLEKTENKIMDYILDDQNKFKDLN